MLTRLKPNYTLYVYDVNYNDFGDAQAAGTPYELKALVENMDSWETDGVSDQTVGNITCQIFPGNAFYNSKNGDLEGLVARFDRYSTPDSKDWYRITSVRPGESLISAEQDLIELTLVSIRVRSQA